MADGRMRIEIGGPVTEGATRKFRFREDGIDRDAFVARFQGQIVAYENVCRHLPIPLDGGDGVFFNSQKTHFICQMHGAVYDPASGKCVRGPCSGASLKRLEVIEDADGSLWLACDQEGKC